MRVDLFDYFEGNSGSTGTAARWAARAPRRPQKAYDLKLVARAPDWQTDTCSLETLERLEHEPWVDAVVRKGEAVRLRLHDDWIDVTGAALEAGGGSEAALSDLAHGRRYSVQFWDPNATKALHVGHLRNLAIGNALASALTQAGGQVERRSLISDMGRAMGEAMAGVTSSGRQAEGWPESDQKSDHFVGACYAEYVAAGGMLAVDQEIEEPEDSLTRELQLVNDAADELMQRVLRGDGEALEIWSKTRAWVIAGQRKTLARLGIPFDRVLFESDFLPETTALTKAGLSSGVLSRRSDGVVVYHSGLEELDELPLVRGDGLPTQHMRSLAYCMTAPDLEHVTSLQVCGSEWVAHLACIQKLANELRPGLNGGFHPGRSIFHGMVARQKRAVASSAEGALLVDDLIESVEGRIDADSQMLQVRRSHPHPERVAAQVALGYFLPSQVAVRIDFEPSQLLSTEESLGWEVAMARARRGVSRSRDLRPTTDPDYRFAVVQSELYRRHLRRVVDRLDVAPLAHYLRHLARWYLEHDRGEHVERVVHTLLDRSTRGLGLDGGR